MFRDSADTAHPYRLGLNLIGVSSYPDDYDTLSELTDDLRELGVQGLRQLTEHDVGWWETFESGPFSDAGSYDFANPDQLITGYSGPFYSVPTLFQVGYDSVKKKIEEAGDVAPSADIFTPHTVRAATVEAAVKEYVTVVVNRYRYSTRHFEVANEVDSKYNGGTLTVSDYYTILYWTRKSVDAIDPEINIVLAGLTGTDEVPFDNALIWLQQLLVIHKAATVLTGSALPFDVVGFHFYYEWQELPSAISRLRAILTAAGYGDVPIWLSEVGSSHDDSRMDDQAGDVFRYLSIAFGNGVELVNWHTYIAGDTPGFGGDGLRQDSGKVAKSYWSYQLFARTLGKFETCTRVKESEDQVYAYLYRVPIDKAGAFLQDKWVLWADVDPGETRSYALPVAAGLKARVTRIIPTNLDGDFEQWEADPHVLTFGPEPLLVEIFK